MICIKSEKRRTEQFLSWVWVPHERRMIRGKGCGRVNMVQILCTHVYKWKNEACSRNGGDKGKNFYKCHNIPLVQN
jgi:hypothetical protein